MLELLKFACSGFWTFCGVALLLNGFFYFMVNMILRVWSRFMRYLMVSKHGWPPSHLDADGDWKEEPKLESAS